MPGQKYTITKTNKEAIQISSESVSPMYKDTTQTFQDPIFRTHPFTVLY